VTQRRDINAGTLCCSSLESASAGLAGVFETTPNLLWEAMPSSVEVALRDEWDPIRALGPALAQELGVDPVLPATIHYFHGTRAFDLTEFVRSGLRPLPEMLDALWSHIGDLAPELPHGDLEQVRRALTAGAIEPATYATRVGGTFHSGPNGHLVREALLHPDAYMAVDYLGGAEIVVDICGAAGNCLGIDLMERYRARTTPCIVEFALEANRVDHALAAAAWYVEAAMRGEHTANANWGHDGHGTPVAPESIVSVTVVDGRR
jgi:hypothetical protein